MRRKGRKKCYYSARDCFICVVAVILVISVVAVLLEEDFLLFAPPGVTFGSGTPANGSTVTVDNIQVDLDVTGATDFYDFVKKDDDVVLWLRMEEFDSVGDAVDDSGNYNNASYVSGASQSSNGRFGESTRFDGSNDRLQIPYDSSLNLGTYYTMSAWFDLDSGSYGDSIVQIRGPTSALLFINEFDNLQGIAYNSQADPEANNYRLIGPSVSTGTWHHVAFVVNNTNLTLYLDGSEVASSRISGTMTSSSTGTSYVGTNNWDGYPGLDEYFDGHIDEVLVIKRPLSYGEIESLYDATANQYSKTFTELNDGIYSFVGYGVNDVGEMGMTDDRIIIVDTSGVGGSVCPNDINETGEVCDGSDLGGQTCVSQGYDSGTLGCNLDCQSFDLSGCYNISSGGDNSLVVSFVSPTPDKGSNISSGSDVNISLYSQSSVDVHYSFVDLDKSLLLLLSMDEVNIGGNPIDRSSYGNDGILINGSVLQYEGGFGNSSRFYDSTNDSIVLPGGVLNDSFNELTVSLWVNNDNDDLNGTMISNSEGNGYGFDIKINPLGRVMFSAMPVFGPVEIINSDSSLPINEWTHVVGVKNSTDISMYIDGVLQTNIMAMNYAINSSSVPMTIGCNYGCSGLNAFNGSIDEVLVFNRSLSRNEVLSLYNSTESQYMNSFMELSDGNYSIKGYAVDISGMFNSTEEREFCIGSVCNFSFDTTDNETEMGNESEDDDENDDSENGDESGTESTGSSGNTRGGGELGEGGSGIIDEEGEDGDGEVSCDKEVLVNDDKLEIGESIKLETKWCAIVDDGGVERSVTVVEVGEENVLILITGINGIVNLELGESRTVGGVVVTLESVGSDGVATVIVKSKSSVPLNLEELDINPVILWSIIILLVLIILWIVWLIMKTARKKVSGKKHTVYVSKKRV